MAPRISPRWPASDGSAVGIGVAGRRSLAVRTEMGWLSLSRLQAREQSRSARQVRQAADAVLSEIVAALGRLAPQSFVLDGELLIPQGHVLSFDALQMRLHPAQSRIDKLSKETSALLMCFDLLEQADGEILLDRPFAARRASSKRSSRSWEGNRLCAYRPSAAAAQRLADGCTTPAGARSTASSPSRWTSLIALASASC